MRRWRSLGLLETITLEPRQNGLRRANASLRAAKVGWAGLTLALLGAHTQPVAASPWTLPKGFAVVTAGFDYQLADSEFLESGGPHRFPLRGQFTGSTISFDGRLGVSDRFELEASLPLRLVSYTSDPVILMPQPAESPQSALDYYQENVIDFSKSGQGVGDLQLAGRYQFLAHPIALATELRIKAPTGYRGPEGTFGPEPKTLEEFAAAQSELVRPAKVADDVTLGDAQLDVSAQLLVGASFSSGTFVRAGGGYKLRLGGAADQVLADLRAGQSIGDAFLVYAGAELAYSIERGAVVGITASSVDPGLPAKDYVGDSNIVLVERRLEADWLNVRGGLIAKITPDFELNVGYARTVWGKNVAATNDVSFSLALHLDAGADESAEASQEE
ncbi:MAG: hypothetical protein HYV07_17020 [Deltaproteobacteria bacterium]|nr:hypothetical protein [Deltaproteobacteria bacterium]